MTLLGTKTVLPAANATHSEKTLLTNARDECAKGFLGTTPSQYKTFQFGVGLRPPLTALCAAGGPGEMVFYPSGFSCGYYSYGYNPRNGLPIGGPPPPEIGASVGYIRKP